MNTDLTSLPENKRSDLRRIVALLREHCPAVGMIILYGSYARGDWKELKDLAPDRKSGHPSDYDILVILRDEMDCSSTARREIDKAGAEAKLSATPRFIYHAIDYVNHKLEIGQYFFSDIVAEGKMLYDSAAFKLAEKKTLTPAERLEIARNDFEQWFETSEQFLGTYELVYSKGWLKLAAFNLHQAAESAYKTVLIVFTGYIPDEHYLRLLGAQAARADDAFHAVFSSDDEFEHDAFTALEYAYIGARYDKRYTIDERSVLYLAERVEALVRLTGERCRERIAVLRKVAGG
jgi:uncharacterized protein